MKIANLFVILSLLLVSCSESDDTNQSFEINGRFTHQISGCDNGGNHEINCVEFIEFIDNSTAGILHGGDMVVLTKYHINNNTIEFEPVGGLNFDISFKIQNNSTLICIQDNNIWRKTE